MVRRLLACLAVLAACLSARAMGNTSDLSLEVVPDPAPSPYAHEMVLVTIRGLYKGNIVRESLETPELRDFAWTQLGWDEWFDAVVDGRSVRVFERRMALFPLRSGSLRLPAFTHNIELMSGGAGRRRVAVRSAAVSIDVAPVPQPAGWWLPARSMTVEEEWEADPEALGLGESATRIVTLEALGLGADRLPPMPVLRSPEVFAFPASEERSVTLTPDGPVARAVWRWSLLPETPQPAVVSELRIGWFDTVARRQREVILPTRRIAVAGEALGRVSRRSRLDALSHLVVPVGVGAGLAAGLILALPDMARRRRLRGGWALLRLNRLREGWRLWRACRRGDATLAQRAARALAGDLASEPRIRPLLHAFDRAAYGKSAEMPVGSLASLGKRLRKASRESHGHQPAENLAKIV